MNIKLSISNNMKLSASKTGICCYVKNIFKINPINFDGL